MGAELPLRARRQPRTGGFPEVWLLIALVVIALLNHAAMQHGHGLHGKRSKAAYLTSTPSTDDKAEPATLDGEATSLHVRDLLHGGADDLAACGLLLLVAVGLLRHLALLGRRSVGIRHLVGHERRGPPQGALAPFSTPVPVSRC